MKVIASYWVCLSSREVVHEAYLHVGTDVETSLYIDDDVSLFKDEVFDLFDNETKGFYHIIVMFDIIYYKSWSECGDEYDLDFHVDQILFKSKCKNFSELRKTWSILKGGL